MLKAICQHSCGRKHVRILLEYNGRQILLKHLRAPQRFFAPGYPAARPKEASAAEINYTKHLAGPAHGLIDEARPVVFYTRAGRRASRRL